MNEQAPWWRTALLTVFVAFVASWVNCTNNHLKERINRMEKTIELMEEKR